MIRNGDGHGIGAARLAGLLGDVRAGRGPAYRTLAAAVRVLVDDGRLPSGTRLPAERALAAELALSRVTVTHAYRDLRSAGWADARQGSGTWVRLPDGPLRPDGAWVPAPVRGGVIDLTHAAPPAPQAMSALLRRAMERLDAELAGHGYGPDGLPALRERVAARFTARGLPTDPDQIVVTSGALHAIGTALGELAGPGDRVLVENPTYPAVLDLIDDVRALPVPVALDREPVQTALPRAARQTAARVAYLMADFQNPTGVLLDDDARARLMLRLARQGVVAIVDETFVDLDLRDGGIAAPTAPGPRPCAAYAPRDDDVVTVGGISKIAWGGLRLGWMRTAREPAARMRRRLARAQISPPILEQLIGVEVLDALDDLRAERIGPLRAQRDRLVAEVGAEFPDWRVQVPDGGLMLWYDLRTEMSTALSAVAPRHGLSLAPGPRFGPGRAFEDRLRLPFTHPEPVLAEAVRRLRRAVDDVGAGPVPEARADLVV
ncbi:PLP-dependent aminotransferase family protein [Pseudonocardia sp. KRD291]|uniref:MocR-like transcription factor YczR n=1 Tax=Pseudonocardia sp. KRD291 TaxID=2792007 RepID=UPI001C4A06BF|nr:PLP-dependent aminotransferase family protein [Pseudonocardia sp. KRD291]MBW0101995.1 PLP-dependent aminotransferase family protein [Pseudonocardia sp. KRD291]